MEPTARARSSPRMLLAALAALAVVAALLVPPASAEAGPREWIVPASASLPGDAEVLDSLAVADALLIRSAAEPPAGVPADAAMDWQTGPGNSQGKGNSEGKGNGGGAGQGDVEAGNPGQANDDLELEGGEPLVALIDTGVAPIDAVEGSVAGEVDFTGEGGGDGYGHGTYMASVIAGSDDEGDEGVGVLSLKVGDEDGGTDLGTVLGALEWLHGPGRDLGVRVGALALGTDPDHAAGQLLDIATQRLAAHGVLIVTAAGNEGSGNLTSPATSPGTLAVGALDGDSVADFSATGTDRAGETAPSLHAKGVEVQGYVSPKAVIVELARESGGDAERLDEGELLGSGTSAATALVAQAAGLVSAEEPELDGLEVRQALEEGAEASDGVARLHADGARIVAGDLADDRAVASHTGPGRSGDNASPNADPNERAEGHEVAPMVPVANWQAATWQDGRWAAGDWAAERWQNASTWRPGDGQWEVFRWRAADWQGGIWDGSGQTAHHWNANTWQRVAYEDAWDVFRWRGDDWDVFRWRSDEWDVFRWRDLQTEVFRWRGDDWEVFRWRGMSWGLMPDE